MRYATSKSLQRDAVDITTGRIVFSAIIYNFIVFEGGLQLSNLYNIRDG